MSRRLLFLCRPRHLPSLRAESQSTYAMYVYLTASWYNIHLPVSSQTALTVPTIARPCNPVELPANVPSSVVTSLIFSCSTGNNFIKNTPVSLLSSDKSIASWQLLPLDVTKKKNQIEMCQVIAGRFVVGRWLSSRVKFLSIIH